MLQITARVFKNNRLVGYQVTDGMSPQILSRRDTWFYVKQKQVLNVTASGDENNPTLSGINGFELKNLPEIKLDDVQAPVGTQENTSGLRSLTQSIFVESELYDSQSSRVTLSPTRNESVPNDAPSHLKYKSVANKAVIGYKIKNIGTQPIRLQRMRSQPNYEKSETVLNPNESMCLSRAELVLLASRPEFAFKLANGEVSGKLETGLERYRVMSSFRVKFYEPNNSLIDIRELESAKTIEEYFTYKSPGKASREEKKQQTRQAIQYKGMFLGFKR